MSNHGGARRGAGRPRKWWLNDKIRVGQACETLWREAVQNAIADERGKLHDVIDMDALRSKALSIPVSKRREWLTSEDGQLYRDDVETELHQINRTLDEPGSANRAFGIKGRPPRGTRK